MEDRVSESAKPERTAADYLNAANAVIDIALVAAQVVPGVGAAARFASAVKNYAPYAKQAVNILPDIAPVVKQAAGALHEKAPDAVAAGTDRVFGAVKGVAGAVEKQGNKVGGAIHDAAEARAQKKARKEARRVLLDGAGIRMSIEQFVENWKTQQQMGEQASEGYLSYCGCYAIATYPSAVKKDDYSSFRDIYIGKSNNMGASIYADVMGKGNVDVYADVKYKQHVYVLLYPCTQEKLDELEYSLIIALDADTSYNKPVELRKTY